jgi:hypothetical protein
MWKVKKQDSDIGATLHNTHINTDPPPVLVFVLPNVRRLYGLEKGSACGAPLMCQPLGVTR